MTLNHLTLNTNHMRASPRHEVGQGTIDYLLPLIPGGGEIDVMPGWHLAFIEQHPGSLFFQLADEPGLSRKPAVMCMVGWGDGDEQAWEDFTIGYEKLLNNPMMTSSKKAPRRAPRRPWLAAYLTPFAATVDGETLMAFGDLERCLAWAILQREGFPGA